VVAGAGCGGGVVYVAEEVACELAAEEAVCLRWALVFFFFLCRGFALLLGSTFFNAAPVVVVAVLEVAALPQPETAAPIATVTAMITNGARLTGPSQYRSIPLNSGYTPLSGTTAPG
jgi:hypothetical protein